MITFLKKWQTEAVDNKLAFKTITDNCWFDDTWISWFLCTYGVAVGGQSLRYNYCSGYTKVAHMIDINQRVATDAQITLGHFKSTVPHDHTPVADARGIVERYVHYMNALKNNWKRTIPLQ